jgi:hypothetical protein
VTSDRVAPREEFGMRISMIPTLAAGLTAVPGSIAQAVLIEVVPAAQDVVQGDTLQVALAVSGLFDQSAPSLGTFDVVVAFDASVLAFASATSAPRSSGTSSTSRRGPGREPRSVTGISRFARPKSHFL